VSVQLWLPRVLLAHVDGQSRFCFAGRTVEEILNHLVELYPSVRPHLFDDHDKLHPFISIFCNEKNIRDLNGLETCVNDGEEIRILPAVAGG